jgi:hypothetical protein
MGPTDDLQVVRDKKKTQRCRETNRNRTRNLSMTMRYPGVISVPCCIGQSTASVRLHSTVLYTVRSIGSAPI